MKAHFFQEKKPQFSLNNRFIEKSRLSILSEIKEKGSEKKEKIQKKDLSKKNGENASTLNFLEL